MIRRLVCASAALLAFAVLPATAGDSGRPQYGSWGFDSAGAEFQTKPGDDFFRYANGTWLDHTTIPADKPGASLRLEMTDRTNAQLHNLLEEEAKSVGRAPTDVGGKVGAFYKAFMDEASIEKLGASAIAPELDRVRKADSRDRIAALMGEANADFFGSLFSVSIFMDLKDTKHYAVYLNEAGLGLPDRDYYLQPSFAAQKSAYQRYVATLLHLLNWPDADARAKSVVALETKIAGASWTRAQDRDPLATYNAMSVSDLTHLAPGFDWPTFLAHANLSGTSRVVIAEKTAFPKLVAIFAETPVDTLQAWEAFNIADYAAPYLSKPFADAEFAFRGKILSGQMAQEDRWKRAVRAVSGGDYGAGDRYDTFGNMGWAVGQLYTAKYFPPEAKTKIEDLVANLKAAFRARIEKLDWMSPSTRAAALKKLDTYTIKVGYPDEPRDYTKLHVLDNDLVGDVRRAAAADWAFYVGRLGGPVDRSEWSMTPQTNDAYNGELRDIVFPAGILQPPVFDPSADPAINYGAAGAIIGHELTHGFDDQGRKIDATGALRDWWAPQDAKTFEARATHLGAQYSAFEPVPGSHINGQLTMGENIADLGGLTLALDAYHASLRGKPAPVIDGLTGDQRVFLGWAQAWRGKYRDDYVRKQVVSDPHSPRQYRVNGVVRNIDAWYSAFHVAPGNRLYVAPKDRVHIW